MTKNRLTSYSITNALNEYAYEILKTAEEVYEHKFSKEDKDMVMSFSDQLIEEHFPETAFVFSLKEEEKESFEKFVDGFIESFIGLYMTSVKLFVDILYINSKIADVEEGEE